MILLMVHKIYMDYGQNALLGDVALLIAQDGGKVECSSNLEPPILKSQV